MHFALCASRRSSVRGRRGLAAAFLVATFLLTEHGSLAQQAALPSELGVIPADATVVGWVRVGELWSGDLGKDLRTHGGKVLDVFLREMQNNLGFELGDVDRVTFAISFPGGINDRPAPLVAITAAKAYIPERLWATLAPETLEHKAKGKTFYSSNKDPSMPAFALVHERLLLLADASHLRRALEQGPGTALKGRMDEALRKAAAGKHHYFVAVDTSSALKQLPKDLPPEAEPFKPLLKVQFATQTMDLGNDVRSVTTFHFANADEAAAGAKALNTAFDMVRPLAAQAFAAIPKEAADIPELAKVVKTLRTALEELKAQPSGSDVKVAVRLEMSPAVLVGMMVPAVQKVREAANRLNSQNNLKWIGLSMHNYESTYGHFPTHALYSKDGKPLLSWRVAILPFIEQDALFKEFKLDEPWDSEHNKKLLARMPKTYVHPAATPKEPYTTYYQVFTGKDAMFNGPNKMSLARVPDGLSNTLMAAEAAEAVPWTKPEDLVYDAQKPLPKLGMFFPTGTNVLFGDGSVRPLRSTLDEKVLRRLIMPADGEAIEIDKLDK